MLIQGITQFLASEVSLYVHTKSGKITKCDTLYSDNIATNTSQSDTKYLELRFPKPIKLTKFKLSSGWNAWGIKCNYSKCDIIAGDTIIKAGVGIGLQGDVPPVLGAHKPVKSIILDLTKYEQPFPSNHGGISYIVLEYEYLNILNNIIDNNLYKCVSSEQDNKVELSSETFIVNYNDLFYNYSNLKIVSPNFKIAILKK